MTRSTLIDPVGSSSFVDRSSSADSPVEARLGGGRDPAINVTSAVKPRRSENSPKSPSRGRWDPGRRTRVVGLLRPCRQRNRPCLPADGSPAVALRGPGPYKERGPQRFGDKACHRWAERSAQGADEPFAARRSGVRRADARRHLDAPPSLDSTAAGVRSGITWASAAAASS